MEHTFGKAGQVHLKPKDAEVYIYAHEEFELTINRLVLEIRSYNPTVILALSRGGLVPAVWLSHALDDVQVIVIYPENASMCFDNCNMSRILIVDDIADTGQTLEKIIENLKGFDENLKKANLLPIMEMRTCVLWYKEHRCDIKLDYVGTISTSDDWVQFPWEKK